jgi:hypothetical protein
MTPSISFTFVGDAIVVAASIVLFWTSTTTTVNNDSIISVAFVGNSFTFVNDLPRIIEAFNEDGKIRQDSMLHGALTVVIQSNCSVVIN